MIRQRGFTMIELLVIVVILGILATVGLNSFSASQMRGRDTGRKADLNSLVKVLEVYYNDFGRYPGAAADGRISGCGVNGAAACDWGGAFSVGNTIYMTELPDDPRATNYYYVSNGSGSEYQIYARLENESDPAVPSDASGPLEYSGTTCGASTLCNYGIASTNSTLGVTE